MRKTKGPTLKNPAISICLTLLTTALATPCMFAQEPDLGNLLTTSPRVVFLGDSITYSGGYVARLDAWLEMQNLDQKPELLNLGLPSETVSGLSEEGHAGGRFPRPDLAERLARVLQKTEPDLIIACYGINCGIYQDFDEQRFQKYQQGIQNLVTRAKACDAQLILLTPPTFDDQRSQRDFSYDAVMTQYAEWLVKQGHKNGWRVIDLHTPMLKELESIRQQTPPGTMQPDAVHPNARGHQVLAEILIEQFQQEVPEETLDPPTGLLSLVQQRQDVLRDAWLKHTGHTRPGLRQGSSLEEAAQKADVLSQQITDSLPQKSP